MSSPGCTVYDAPPAVICWPGFSRLAVVTLAATSDETEIPRPGSVAGSVDSGSCCGTANTAAFGSARLSVTSAVLWKARSGIVELPLPLPTAGKAVISRQTVAVGSWLKISAGRPGPSWPTW